MDGEKVVALKSEAVATMVRRRRARPLCCGLRGIRRCGYESVRNAGLPLVGYCRKR